MTGLASWPSKPAVDLFLLRKTNEEKDGRPKTENDRETLKEYKKRICTLNICEIKDKDPDIVEFMKKWKISVLGISDCPLKGNGTRQIQDNYVLTWSGVNTRERAIHGVAFVMQPDRVKKKKGAGNRFCLRKTNEDQAKVRAQE